MRLRLTSDRHRELTFVGFLICALMVLLLAAEAAIRMGIHGIIPPENEEASNIALWRDGGVFVPGISFFRMRSNSTFGNIRLNNLGLRGPDVEEPKPDDRVRIAVLGNSTVFGLELQESEALPAQIVARLSDRNPACRFDYISIAGPNYAHADFAWLMRNALSSADIDHVVIVHPGPGAQAAQNLQRKFYERFKLYEKLQDLAEAQNGTQKQDREIPKRVKKSLIAKELKALDQILGLARGADIWYHTFYDSDRTRADSLTRQWYSAVSERLSASEAAVVSDKLQTVPATDEFFYTRAHYTPKGAAQAAGLIADSFFETFPEQNAMCK